MNCEILLFKLPLVSKNKDGTSHLIEGINIVKFGWVQIKEEMVNFVNEKPLPAQWVLKIYYFFLDAKSHNN